MKFLFFVLSVLTSITSLAQIAGQVQAKRGVFTDGLFLKDRWITHISSDLYTDDSTNDNILVTGKAIARYISIKTANNIQNQFANAQSANLWIQGAAVMGSQSLFRNTLASGFPAQAYVTQSGSQYGLAIQRSSIDKGGANVVLFKNHASNFNTLNALQFGDPIGSINFSGVAGDNSTIINPTSIYGFVEKTAPSYLTSGFIFNTTDTNGVNARRMGINAVGNLMIGNATTNPYQLNVVSGDVRFNNLDPEDYLVLAGSDNDGGVKPIYLGDRFYYDYDNSALGVSLQDRKPYNLYLAVLSQTGQNDPTVIPLGNSLAEYGNIVWTRNSTGVYTGTLSGGFPFAYTWFKLEASDQTGDAFNARIYRAGPSTVKLIVKDSALNNTDNWANLSLEIRGYIAL